MRFHPHSVLPVLTIKMEKNKIKKKEKKKPHTILCECGMPIEGISEDHAKANLKNHQASKIHKKLMKTKGKKK